MIMMFINHNDDDTDNKNDNNDNNNKKNSCFQKENYHYSSLKVSENQSKI